MTLQLTLFIPALLEAMGDETPSRQTPFAAPALETLLSRSRREQGVAGGNIAAHFELFGLGVGAGTNDHHPAAALTGLYDGIDSPTDGLWLRADPVHLAADRDRVVMAGYDALAVRPDEAEQLASEFNALFGEDDLTLHTPTSNRWYLRVPQVPDFSAGAVEEVVGQDVDPHLPRGEGALAWHRLLNEVQMLFHASAVNQARQQRGDMPVNSLWFWGGGALPDAPAVPPWSGVWSNDAVSRALARYCRTVNQGLPPTAEEWLDCVGEGRHLVMVDGVRDSLRRGDLAACQAVLDGVENEWIVPLSAALKSARLGEVRLMTGDSNAYIATAKTLRRWWARRRPLSHFQRRG